MNARIDQGLVWIFVAALAGCSASDGSGKPASGTGRPAPGAPGGARKPAPGAPGNGKTPPARPGPGIGGTGAVPSECFGPSTLTAAAREQLVAQVCGGQGHRATPSGGATQGGACASAYQVRSDAQIAGILSAWNDAVVRESSAADRDAADPGVRDVAHLLTVAHARAKDEQGQLFGRASIKPEQSSASRAIDSGYQAECRATQAGATSGREYVMRQIEAEERSIQLLDALAPQARSADVRCALQVARAVTETQIDHACWVMSSTYKDEGAGVGTAQSPQTAEEPADVDDAGQP